MLNIQSLDHLVLTVRDLSKTATFYRDVLGMQAEQFKPADGSTRWALSFGIQKINLHQARVEFEPKAGNPTPGRADLCFLSEAPLSAWIDHLGKQNVGIEEGPIARAGVQGPILSIYLRDPDGNLVEISNKAGA